ncbi:prepilin-type N-terminal cleavage/methylation domain-containing protein [Deinococcus sp. HSC-46F16]|nr:prepilin-type N-terminal cleavage/methylation domain-containing protein [Deinococcus sp. HSC-46F16]MCP2014243.1 prepilin-type N-terminal cleavage/methylation domain-containing protein [Deinococcus sp. HSC-46F16]
MKRRPSTEGFTLLELLLALTILGILLTLLLQSSSDTIRLQTRTEQEVSLESSLRRTVAILAQDFRNSAYGLVTDTPYTSTETAISMAQMVDTGVYPVVGPTGNGFPNANNLQALAPSGFAWPRDTPFLLIHPARELATVLDLNASSTVGGNGQATLNHSGQPNTLCFSPGNLVQRLRLVGYTYDAGSQMIFRGVRAGATVVRTPLAFNVTGFQIQYVDTEGTAYSSFAALPQTRTLSRIQLSVTMQRTRSGQTLTRSLSSTVEIPKVFTLTARPLRYVVPGTSVTCS